MLDHFDQEELLAYIEGELPPDETARLEHELANSPRAAMQVERLRRDRELLRTDREPVMPRNLLPRIESRLARPMLMETWRETEAAGGWETSADAKSKKPGVMRRQHRRATLRRRLMKLAMAAAIALVIGAGMWTAVTATNLTERAQSWMADRSAADEPASARASRADEPAVAGDDEDDPPAPWPPGAVVHHAPSPAAEWAGRHGAPTRRDEADEEAIPAGQAAPLDLLMVIAADDPSEFESALTLLVESLDAPAALVQNFSYDEAARLAAAWSRDHVGRRSERGAAGSAEARGSFRTPDHSMSRLADDARQQLRRTGGAQSLDDVDQSRRLVGSRELAAPFAVQLSHSGSGATHTITMPAGRFHELLAAINRTADGRVMLRRMSDSAASGDTEVPTARDAWLTRRRELPRLLRPLERLADEAIIHLPVRVERKADR